MVKILVKRLDVCEYCTNQGMSKCTKNGYCGGRDFKPQARIVPNRKSGSSGTWEMSWEFTKKLVKIRDHATCMHCGSTKTEKWEVHHIKHQKFKGTDHPRNLLLLCTKCHKDTLGGYTEKLMKEQHRAKTYEDYWSNLINPIDSEKK